MCDGLTLVEKLTEDQIVACIRSGKCFAATIDSGSFQIRINRYVPMVVTAIHDGHRVIDPFAKKMKVSDAERQFEEDPHTGAIAETMDISIKVLDSRYFCDLNRSEELCSYEEEWGKEVWNEPLDADEKQRMLQSHRTYYRILDVLLTKLVKHFGAAVLYDMHSYNYSRIGGSPPLFNIGTRYIDMQRFGPVIEHLVGELQAIELPETENRTVLDEVFVGNGYQSEFTHYRHPDVLCIPLELKKVFMDEQRFTIKDDIYVPLFAGTEQALKANGSLFMKRIAADYRGDEGENARN